MFGTGQSSYKCERKIYLVNEEKLFSILKDELIKIKEEYTTPRLTEIAQGNFDHDIEDLIQKEDMVVTVTLSGYIKRVPLNTYRAQKYSLPWPDLRVFRLPDESLG